MIADIVKLEECEYDVLRSVPDGFCPDPKSSIAIVAMVNGQVVGRMLLLSLGHLEGTWIKEEFRHGTTGIRMMKRMEQEAKDAGLKTLFSYAATEEVEDYLERLDYKRCKVSVWAKEL